MTMLPLWLQRLFVAYIWSMIAFFLLRFLFRQARSRTAGFLQTANSLVLIAVLLNFVWTIFQAARCRYCYGFVFYFTLAATALLAFLFHLCFFYRRFRVGIGASLISVILLSLYVNLDLLTILFTHLYPDGRASTWSTYYAPTPVSMWAVALTIAFFLVCWVSAKRP